MDVLHRSKLNCVIIASARAHVVILLHVLVAFPPIGLAHVRAAAQQYQLLALVNAKVLYCLFEVLDRFPVAEELTARVVARVGNDFIELVIQANL